MSIGGVSPTGGDSGGLGADAGAGGAADNAAAPAARIMSEPPAKSSRARSLRACYTLGGYDVDPCLPPDDAVLAWLNGVPAACDAHIAEGPFPGEALLRNCCYTVVCAQSPSR